MPILGGFAIVAIVDHNDYVPAWIAWSILAAVANWLINALAVVLADIAHRLAQLVEIGRNSQTEAGDAVRDVAQIGSKLKEIERRLYSTECEAIHLRHVAQDWAEHAGVKISDPPSWFGKE